MDRTTHQPEYETAYEETLTRDELATYLKALRKDLTGRYEEMRPPVSDKGTGQRPQPTEEITVVERSNFDSDDQMWEVSLRWQVTTDESNG